MKKVVEIATTANGREPNPEFIISDFEMIIINATEAIFPNARFQLCFFHSWTSKLVTGKKIDNLRYGCLLHHFIVEYLKKKSEMDFILV